MSKPTGDTLTFQTNARASAPSHIKAHTHAQIFSAPNRSGPSIELWAPFEHHWKTARAEGGAFHQGDLLCSAGVLAVLRMLWRCLRTLAMQWRLLEENIYETDDDWTCLQWLWGFWPLWKHSVLSIVMDSVPASWMLQLTPEMKICFSFYSTNN